jgi:hypothetical protein
MIEKIMKDEAIEPTFEGIIEAMQRGFTYMEERFELTDARIDQRFGLLSEIMNNFNEQLSDIEKDTGPTKVAVLEIQEELWTLGHAVDKDAELLINHENRIELLEKAR